MTPEEKAQAVEVMAEAIWRCMSPNKDAVMNAVDGKNPAPTPKPYTKMAIAALEALLRWQEERKMEETKWNGS